MSQEHTIPFSGLDGLPALGDAALDAVRSAGAERFKLQGLPTHRIEAWKYTRLSRLDDGGFRIAGEADGAGDVTVRGVLADDQVAARFVIVNGQPRDDLSSTDGLPAGVRLTSLSDLAASDPAWLNDHLGAAIDGDGDSLVSLNAAALGRGFALVVDAGVTLDKPIEINAMSSGNDTLAWFPRNLVVLGENADVTVVASHAGAERGASFVNSVTELTLAQNARLRAYSIDETGAAMTSVSRVYARLGRSATLQTFGLMSGAGLNRTEQTVMLEGEGAEAMLDGGYLLRGSAHGDNTTRIEHRVPHTTCNEVFKGVVDDTARAVFQGKIVVCKDAQHADGQMLNKTLLLSNKAEIDTKPELEIYADDVKCAHGATSGKIDDAALFYLRSRGIPERVARNLLVRSFLGEATDRIAHEGVRDAVSERIEQWLPEASADMAEEAAA